MSEQDTMPKYEAKVWQNGTWKAKLLRDGMAWSLVMEFETQEEAFAWAREEAEKDRAAVIAESKAVRVEL
jgi:hypothetical protein